MMRSLPGCLRVTAFYILVSRPPPGPVSSAPLRSCQRHAGWWLAPGDESDPCQFLAGSHNRHGACRSGVTSLLRHATHSVSLWIGNAQIQMSAPHRPVPMCSTSSVLRFKVALVGIATHQVLTCDAGMPLLDRRRVPSVPWLWWWLPTSPFRR